MEDREAEKRVTLKWFLPSEVTFTLKQATDRAQLPALVLQKLILNVLYIGWQRDPYFRILKAQKDSTDGYASRLSAHAASGLTGLGNPLHISPCITLLTD